MVLLVHLCVTGAKSTNDSTALIESVCLNPPLSSLVVASLLRCLYGTLCYVHGGYICGYG